MTDDPWRACNDTGLSVRLAIVEEILKANAKALELQTAELARRLHELNNASERERDMLATYTPRLVYDKSEYDTREWRRETDAKFANYLPMTSYDSSMSEARDWRRTVDAALVSAASKSGVLWAILAMAVAAGGLFVAIFNAFARGVAH